MAMRDAARHTHYRKQPTSAPCMHRQASSLPGTCLVPATPKKRGLPHRACTAMPHCRMHDYPAVCSCAACTSAGGHACAEDARGRRGRACVGTCVRSGTCVRRGSACAGEVRAQGDVRAAAASDDMLLERKGDTLPV
jgi:hypothetical protein